MAEELKDDSFPGQQDGEKILYVIRPHWYRNFATTRNILFLLAGILALLFIAPEFIAEKVDGLLSTISVSDTLEDRLTFFLGISIVTLLYLWWYWGMTARNATYLTDRRLVRFERSRPFTRRKRSLLWAEVAKAKGWPATFVARMLKVGNIELRAKVSSDENIVIPNVYMFDDMANYLDKILHISHVTPIEMSTMRPFIAKKKGERY